MSELTSHDPWDGAVVSRVHVATKGEVGMALERARRIQPMWAKDAEVRKGVVSRLAGELGREKEALSTMISRETGKVLWEARLEVDAMVTKCGLSLRAEEERRKPMVRAGAGGTLATTYRPHGVAAVVGPFNFPGHLPLGHIAPALLAGNAVVFKPSEKTPGVGDALAECLRRSGLPEGVLQVMHGGAETATALLDADIDAVMFTGSYAVGTRILARMAERPGVLTALEMGGNNPLVVWGPGDVRGAVVAILQSAFATAGQRCSCARRLVVAEEDGGVVEAVVAAAGRLRIGHPREEADVFYGPVVSAEAAQRVLDAQAELIAQGAAPLLPARRDDRSAALLTPGVVDVTGVRVRDEEVFGPVLQVVRVGSFEEAVRAANDTRYGLCAGLISEDEAIWEVFRQGVRAGVMTFNRPTTGASSELPFGGTGRSGNHRPSAYFAADYCSFAVGEMSSRGVSVPATLPPGILL